MSKKSVRNARPLLDHVHPLVYGAVIASCTVVRCVRRLGLRRRRLCGLPDRGGGWIHTHCGGDPVRLWLVWWSNQGADAARPRRRGPPRNASRLVGGRPRYVAGQAQSGQRGGRDAAADRGRCFRHDGIRDRHAPRCPRVRVEQTGRMSYLENRFHPRSRRGQAFPGQKGRLTASAAKTGVSPYVFA